MHALERSNSQVRRREVARLCVRSAFEKCNGRGTYLNKEEDGHEAAKLAALPRRAAQGSTAMEDLSMVRDAEKSLR